jgi:hypothetical protein
VTPSDKYIEVATYLDVLPIVIASNKRGRDDDGEDGAAEKHVKTVVDCPDDVSDASSADKVVVAV